VRERGGLFGLKGEVEVELIRLHGMKSFWNCWQGRRQWDWKRGAWSGRELRERENGLWLQ
jgi:hypothetical protein